MKLSDSDSESGEAMVEVKRIYIIQRSSISAKHVYHLHLVTCKSPNSKNVKRLKFRLINRNYIIRAVNFGDATFSSECCRAA